METIGRLQVGSVGRACLGGPSGSGFPHRLSHFVHSAFPVPAGVYTDASSRVGTKMLRNLQQIPNLEP